MAYRNLYRLIFTIGTISLGMNAVAEEQLGTEGYAKSGDLQIHYVTAGEGPLMVMVHGFPDYWYTWRNQMPELSKHYQVVAIDQRGYNKSGQPEGVENYSVDKLASDVAAVIKHFGRDRAIIVGHDWGGIVSWTFAMMYPEMTEKLIILNTPHPHGIGRELATNPEQEANSEYARNFQKPDAASKLSAFGLAFWVKDPVARKKYIEAFKRSSMEGMLNYYKANYPRPPYQAPEKVAAKVKCPVLMIHGLKDKYLLAAGLNSSWDFVDDELTIVTLPDADHFVQHDRPDKVTKTILNWLEPAAD
ncbi:MAG: alpha/beta hydrolase [Pirellulaceae bacterium]|nr:alpha/beta hydrolase [Pirellulaceae bacterium]